MNRKNNSTWTDELRSAFENAEMSPSEGSWERLQADLGKRRAAAWLPYAGLATALAAAVLGVFLFTRKDPQQGVTVIESPQGGVVAQAPEAAPKASAEPRLEIPSTQEATEPKAAAKPKAETTVSVAPITPEEVEQHREETSIKDEAPHREEITVEESTANNADPFREDSSNGHPVTLERKKERRKLSVSLSGGGLGGNQGSISTPMVRYPSTVLMTKSDGEYISDGPNRVMDISELIEHQVPVKLGVNLDIPVGKKMYIGSGVEYSCLRSSVAGEKQTLHWLGVPLNFKYRIAQGRALAAGIGAGATVETCLDASLLGREYKESAQFSARVFADLRVPLTPVLSLYACPELSYYFTQTNLPTYRSGKPLAFGVTAGLAIDL
jgi:hypothetical protein